MRRPDHDAIARVLAEPEPRLRERLFRRPEGWAGVPDPFHSGEPGIRFRWLLGESRTWNGEPVVMVAGELVCTFCRGLPLPRDAYCLGCDRCGRELEIPSPGPVAACRAVGRPSGLRGGLEGKR